MVWEIWVFFDLMEMLCISGVKTAVTGDETEDDLVWLWLDSSHEADVRGKYVLVTVYGLEVGNCS